MINFLTSHKKSNEGVTEFFWGMTVPYTKLTKQLVSYGGLRIHHTQGKTRHASLIYDIYQTNHRAMKIQEITHQNRVELKN